VIEAIDRASHDAYTAYPPERVRRPLREGEQPPPLLETGLPMPETDLIGPLHSMGTILSLESSLETSEAASPVAGEPMGDLEKSKEGSQQPDGSPLWFRMSQEGVEGFNKWAECVAQEGEWTLNPDSQAPPLERDRDSDQM